MPHLCSAVYLKIMMNIITSLAATPIEVNLGVDFMPRCCSIAYFVADFDPFGSIGIELQGNVN